MNAPGSTANQSPRVTMRTVAIRAGVSVQAVSLALRNHPSIAPETRRRIQKLATDAGYVPDPSLVKLMHHLRATRGQKLAANVCALTTRAPASREAFCDLLLEGVIAAAGLAGFAVQVIHVDGDGISRPTLQRMLRTRGVEGLVLLPMATVGGLDDLLDWREFSVVSATLSVTSPRFDCVAANHFANVFNLCSRLREAGYRRPGLVVHRRHDERCGFNITAAHGWHGIYGDLGLVRAHLCERLESAALRRWLAAESPDVLLAEHDDLAQELGGMRPIIGTRPIVSCSARPQADGRFPFPGNHDKPRRIGAVAVEMLTRMIAVGKRGVPEDPHMTVINGEWVGGAMSKKR